jgi:lipopolysaccharide transport system ATP-binding protein
MTTISKGAVVFEGVSKRYRLGVSGTLRDAMSGLLGRNDGDDRRVLWALQGVSFRVDPGQALALIGPNGAGKTTTLKLLSNITRPTSGRITVEGRLSSLIELGAGFHPELTGRENIFLNGAILGLKHNEVKRKFDEIVAFSELERFIDTPVKRYSSGMYVRLGFAVAAYIEPDVLVVDEVLAVGDSAFRQKCMARMETLRQNGTTLIFVSHNMYQVRRLCDQALLLIHGTPIFLGDTHGAISVYEESIQSNQKQQPREFPTEDTQSDLIITEISLSDVDGKPLEKLHHNQSLRVQAKYRAREPVVEPIVKIRLIRSDGVVCAMTASHHKPDTGWTFAQHGEISVLLDPVQLTTGSYVAEVRIADNSDSMFLAGGQSNGFVVQGPSLMHEPDQGTFVPNTIWSHIGG